MTGRAVRQDLQEGRYVVPTSSAQLVVVAVVAAAIGAGVLLGRLG